MRGVSDFKGFEGNPYLLILLGLQQLNLIFSFQFAVLD
jgi:hypothetical protein